MLGDVIRPYALNRGTGNKPGQGEIAMSTVGRESGNKQVDATCPGCQRTFEMSARTILDGGTARCPRCGATFRSDGSAGKELDATIRRFQRSMKDLKFKR